MCILKEVERFVKNGISTFGDASRGCYKQHSEAISEIRKEMFGNEGNRHNDKRNLIEDRRNVERDIYRTFERYVLSHG